MRWLVTSYLKFVTTLHHGFDHCLLTFFQSSSVSRRIYLQQSGNLWKHGKEVWKPLSEAEIKHPSFRAFHDSKTRTRISTLLKQTTNLASPAPNGTENISLGISVFSNLPGTKKYRSRTFHQVHPQKLTSFYQFHGKQFH